MKLSLPLIRFTTVIIAVFLICCETEDNKKYQRELEQNGVLFNSKNYCKYIVEGDIDTVEMFLKAGISIDVKFTEYDENYKRDQYEGKTALMLTSSLGNLEMAKFLVDNGANVNKRSSNTGGPYDNGLTALMLASENGHIDVVTYLLDKGASVNYKHALHEESAIMLAAKNGHTDIVKLLLDHKADISYKRDGGSTSDKLESGETALMYAARNGHTETVKLLIENGAKINELNDLGESTFILAAQSGKVDMMDFLIKNGADINLQAPNGKTALFEVLNQENNLELVKFLAENKADLNKKENEKEWSALMFAVENHQTELANLLLESGADPNIVGKYEITALSLATKNGYDEIADLLKKYIRNN